jgi:hypothetical protein
VSTFEGPDHLSVSECLNSPLLANEIEKICLNIVKHIADVSGGNVQISRMTLYFKNDVSNRLWLMFCSRLRVRDNVNKGNKDNVQSPRLVMAKTNEFPPEQEFMKNIRINNGLVSMRNGGTIPKINSTAKNPPYKFEAMKHCPSCLRQEGTLYNLSFRNLIETFLANAPEKLEHMRTFPEKENQKSYGVSHSLVRMGGDDDDKSFTENVPMLIQWLWGALKERKYGLLIENPSWMGLSIKVCYKCYFEFTELAVTNNMASSGTMLVQDI